MTTPAAAPVPYAEFDGHPATEDDLRTAAFFNYGHFTAMQVRQGRVRGLGLHMDRLDSANRALFELPLDGDSVRELIRHALRGAGVADGSVRVHGFLPPGATATTVMVTVRGPVTMSAEPRTMMSVPYARAVPHLKRPGEFGQTYYGNLASRAGFDDAVLTLPDGSVTEGAVTNIGFWDGESVVWPQAPALLGTTMALLEQEFPAAGVRSRRSPVTLDGLGAFSSAFVTNSQGIAPVRRIDGTEFVVDEELMGRLEAAYASAPWDSV
ncbi:branched-subunit amino acid aminotransferase/4-amino-4-deoxychorismate lyase [Streptomyces sp. 840.1]|uniref:aminotransferase class IV family protein n=1 Tax=Streptomyces sp. 840.1 TaxID=2485152 RepID=UPI000F462A30|nr:aminotransferase class IV family protein [Streptomyces sp. 840.1]ROQ69068.1 branched-subunit amino acid aminotransferase/4-amino-4-deoxychorismate lyase [Streptomyces sp. 840.1]